MNKFFYSVTRKTGRTVHNCIVFADTLEHACAILQDMDTLLDCVSFDVREA